MGITPFAERLPQPEETVLRAVRQKSVRTTDLMAASSALGLSESEVREAVWSLLDDGALELTPDRHLVPRDAA